MGDRNGLDALTFSKILAVGAGAAAVWSLALFVLTSGGPFR